MIPTLPLLALALLSLADDPATPRRPDPAEVASALEDAVAVAIERARPSVVAIVRVKGETDETTAVRGREQVAPPQEPAGLVFPGFPEGEEDFVALPGDYGSGVVVGPKGEILTTYHVIRGAARIRVRAPGRKEFAAEVLAADPRSDLAVLAPRGVDPATLALKPLPIGDASKLRAGSFLVALGNPYNAARDGKASAGWGILANTARRLERPGDSRFGRGGNPLQFFRYQPTLLQLDAKMNLGMSGGAVVNLKGELVGVTTTGGNPDAYDAQAGYAIPMDALGRRAVEALREGQEVEYGFLGIAISRQVSNLVERVQSGTPADGVLVQNDTIIGVGDRAIDADDGLSLALSAVPPGKPVKLTIRRADGQVVEKTLALAKYPLKANGLAPVIATSRPTSWRGLRIDFTSVLIGDAIDDDLVDRFRHVGVGVVEVESGSPAEAAGLKPGQVVTEVEGRPVKTPDDFRRAVAGARGPVTLTTERGEAPGKAVTVK